MAKIKLRYNSELDSLFAAARLGIDGIINPCSIRLIISHEISEAVNNPVIPHINPEVLQV
jgi:hypothetical protein